MNTNSNFKGGTNNGGRSRYEFIDNIDKVGVVIVLAHVKA